MTRFTDETIQCLKETMRKRMPDCYFTQEDVEAIKAQTGLSDLQIDMWCRHFRCRFNNEQNQMKFLMNEIEVLNTK